MGSKQKITDISLPDRISDLPSDIISFILDRLSVRDAVATSILSKDWRHKWKRIGNLIFDEEFLVDVISHSIDLEYSNIIRRILLLHIGPVRIFVLHIPGCTYPSEFLSLMMHFISRSEVKELVIVYHSPKFRLPEDIFHCNELRHLKLDIHTLDLLPPQDFGGLCNLISLDLRVSIDEGVIGNLISKCPLLERLSLDFTACKQPLDLVIDAPPRLYFLNVCIYMDSDVLFTLKNGHGVADMLLDFGGFSMDFCNLISIFGSVPKVETALLCLPGTLADMPPGFPMSLPTTLHNFKSLTLHNVDISSLEYLYFVLCVLKSSPNLQMLNLGLRPFKTSEDEDALHLLDMQTRETLTLNCLLTVKIQCPFGSKTGIEFIKLILSCSPILKTLVLMGEDNEPEFNLMSELLQCPRSSSRVEVIFSEDFNF
ncbi:unnamed protein product [Rhodiola kirilowii]